MAFDITIKKGDRSRSVSADLSVDGVAINLSGCTVTFIMRNRATNVVKVNAACVIVTAATGSVRYDWGATDTNEVGDYDVEFKITNGSGLVERVPTHPGKKYYSAQVWDNLA